MVAISVNTAKQNIEKYVQATIDNHQETIITTDKGAVVMINQEHWNDITGSLHLLREQQASRKNKEAEQEDASSNPTNTIEFVESNTERVFKASFSDTVGENISQVFLNAIEGRLQTTDNTKLLSNTTGETIAETEATEAVEAIEVTAPAEAAEETDLSEITPPVETVETTETIESTEATGSGKTTVVTEALENDEPTEITDVMKSDETVISTEETSDEIVHTDATTEDIIEKTKNPIIALDENGNVKLLITNLKSRSKLDYGKRLSLLVVDYFEQVHGQTSVERKVINAVLKQAGVFDSNISGWLSQAHFFSKEGKTFSLRTPGKEKAQSIKAEILDDNISSSWEVSDMEEGGKTVKKGGKTAKGKSKKDTFNLIKTKELFSPSKEDSFKAFASGLNLKTNPQRILAIVYYLEKKRGIEAIDYDHIYTGLKEFGKKMPTALYQAVSNVKSKKEWLQKEGKYFSVSDKGVQAIEQEFKN